MKKHPLVIGLPLLVLLAGSLTGCGDPDMLSDDEKLEKAAKGRSDYMKGQPGTPPVAPDTKGP